MLATTFITFSRVRLSPQRFSTSTNAVEVLKAVSGPLSDLSASGIVLRHEGAEFLHPGIAVPLRIGDIHLIAGAQDALGIIETGGPEHRPDRRRHVCHDLNRMPAEFGDFLDRLRRKFWRADVDENIRVGG